METLLVCLLSLSASTSAFFHHPRTIVESSTSTSSKTSPTTTCTCEPTPYATCTRPSNTTFYPPTAHFGPTYPATLRIDSNGESIILAALSSATATWTEGANYRALESAVYEAAPPPAQKSLSISGYNWDAIVRSEWYNTSVPTKWQNLITDEEKELQRVFDGAVRGHVVSSGWRLTGDRWATLTGGVLTCVMLGVIW